MSVESDFVSFLRDTLGHERVYPYPMRMDGSVVLPALTYVRVATERIRSHDGTSAVRPLFQVSVWGQSAKDASEVAIELVDAIEALRPFWPIEDDRGPFYENSLKLHRRDLDIRVWATLEEEVSPISS